MIKHLIINILNRINRLRYIRRITCSDSAIIYYSARISFTNSKSITIGNNSRVYGNLRTVGSGKIQIGQHSQVGHYSRIGSVTSITIGNNTAVADHVIIIDNNNHPVNPIDRHYMQMTPSGSIERSWVNSDSAPIIIGNDCWIGQYSRICKGVTIGDGAVVAANSVVTKDVPPNSIAAGNPAKIVKTNIDELPRYFQNK